MNESFSQDLSLFLAVAETGSISAAARFKNISQPVVSIHVRKLEEYFGISLLDRYGRGIRLTDAGGAPGAQDSPGAWFRTGNE